MRIGANISVIAVGAILAFATRVHTAGFSIQAVGAVLMLVGLLSLVLRIGSVLRQRELTTTQVLTAPQNGMRVRPAGATAGPRTPNPNPYAGTTAELLKPGEELTAEQIFEAHMHDYEYFKLRSESRP
ncbi:MAG TPA: hypothetical protein VH372_25090 [Actinospica sp.]|jgi:hypothetical protein|nr:hypothetical protein [Actinospica sp.]